MTRRRPMKLDEWEMGCSWTKWDRRSAKSWEVMAPLVLVDLDQGSRGRCKVRLLFGPVRHGFLEEDLDRDELVFHHLTGALLAEIADVATLDRGDLAVGQQLLITKAVSGSCGREGKE